MKPIVERLELGKNNFSKWVNGILLIVAVAAFIISINEPGNTKWICLGGALLFGGICWHTIKYRIITYQEGFTVYTLFAEKNILWKDVTVLTYDVAYHGKGVELKLHILYSNPRKKIELSVKQFNKQKMQRFFEMLYEQCPNAVMNEHFIKQATGEMKNWKDQLKMY